MPRGSAKLYALKDQKAPAPRGAEAVSNKAVTLFLSARQSWLEVA